MRETNGHEISVALYDRLSTKRQAEEGYALDGHLHELRERMAATGRRIVAEVSDPDEKRWMSDRPGVDEIKRLAAAGEIAEVWAWSWTRYGESPVPEVLAIELAEHGVRLRSLDDGGEGLGGEIMRAVRGVLSREEQRDRVRKAAMGKRSKARSGHVLGTSPRPRYGFAYVRNDKGKVVGYEVLEKEMAIVRRIIGMLADGRSLYAVQTTLEAEGVKAPQGGDRWHRPTVKDIVREDSYLPHTPGELAALVSERLLAEEVYSGLDLERPYGISYYGRTRSSYVSTRSKRRRVEPVPREEWVAIPLDLSGSGLERGQMERARASVADNRATARVGDRFWELSRGFLFCADCGRAMTADARRERGRGRAHFYYRCRVRRGGPDGLVPLCPNRKGHRADQLEYEAAALFERYADRGTLLELYDRAVEEQEERTGTRGSQIRRAALTERLSELDLERKGYLRQGARGVLSDSELDEMLAEIDAQCEGVQDELRAVEDQAAAVRRMQAARASLASAEWFEDPDAIQPGEWLTLGARPEEIRRAYRRYGARFEVDWKGTLTLRLELALGGEALHIETSS